MSVVLGDSHNFGRRVSMKKGRVLKPRAMLWEWLLLAAESPLRRLLDAVAERDGWGSEAFGFLPTLEFFRSRSRSRSQVGGEVERLALEPLCRASKSTRRELASVVGRSLALWSWLGVSDLHWENLALGVDVRGRLVFGPLDIEMILSDLSLPTETKLLPDADPEYAVVCQHAAGVRRALPYLGKPVEASDLLTMAAQYRATLLLLERHASAIAKVFASLPGLGETPIRVCLRGTEEYVRATSEPLWPPLLDAEAEQLARGDIPYFFRLYARPGIHYYANRELTELRRLPLRGDTPKLERLLPVARGLRSPTRQRLREDGLFALLGAFDHPAFTGRHSVSELTVKFGARSLVARLPSGEELRSARNLSAFVSSVYLPCRCGEVRSVFVPAVTQCRASAGSV
ncbi:MAG TPA: hypothetical protein VNG33_20555 [Polyangiaceae bacterium]|nr:hypothetical protein [Polyangiaceae bacterium]